MADPQPLLVPREQMIARLEERKKEAEDARKKAEDEAAAYRQALLDKVAGLTTDQVANILHHFVVGGPQDGLLKWLDDVQENKKFVSVELKPSGIETTLEKLIRVLSIATNKEIEVYSTDPLYSYI